jgi:1-phosphofructokinase family hexose kinase
MRALTLTLHPAIDRVADIDRLIPGGVFDVRPRLCAPAGKGVNTARVLRRLWPQKNKITAAVWVGAEQAAWFKKRLAENDNIAAKIFPRNCATRQAFTLLEPNGRETHLKEAMPPPTSAEQSALLRAWKKTVARGDLLAVCGSAPAKTSVETLRQIFELAKMQEPARIIADTNGAALEVAASAGLHGIKGNAAEIGAWLKLGGPFNPLRGADRACLVRNLKKRGAPRAVLATLGAVGAAWFSLDAMWLAEVPRVPRGRVVSATGCGDAATAGWLWALADGLGAEETLRRAAACGTAKILSADPGRLSASNAREIAAKITLRRLL